jgi:hypothetical protein
MDPLELAQHAPDAPSFERAVLDALGRAVGFDVAFLAVKNALPTTVGMDPATVARAVADDAYKHELAPLQRAAFARRHVVVDTEVLGELGVRRTSYFRDLAAPVGGRHGLLAYLTLRGRPLGLIVLGRRGGRFASSDVSRVESILPAIAVARASFGWAAPHVPRPLPRAGGHLADLLGKVRGERVWAKAASSSGSIVVRDRGGYREMVERRAAVELVWSRAHLDDPSRSGWSYVDLLHLAASRASKRERALFIGCGGAVALHQFARVYPGMTLDVVESDRHVIELARTFFGLDAIPRVAVHVFDGVEFVERAAAERWDVVVVDAYDGCELATGFASGRFFANVRRMLAPGGAAAFNVVGSLRGDRVLQRVERAARAELADVRLVPVLDPGEDFAATSRRNVVVVGARR